MHSIFTRLFLRSLFFSIILLSIFEIFKVQPAFANISLDTTYGNNGIVITSFGHDANANRMAIQPSDGKSIVVGSAFNGSIYGWAVARYNTSGTLDTTFGTNGIVTKYFDGNSFLNTVAIQSDGKIVVGGNSYHSPTVCSHQPNFTHNVCWTVARFNSDGSLDSTFGTGGIVYSDVRDGTDPENLSRLTIQPSDGKIVAVGSAFDLGVVRYNTNGSEDFNDLIVIPDSYSCPPTIFNNTSCGELGPVGASAVHIQQDGKILISGNAGNHMFLLRLNSNNSFDTAFGHGGLFRTNIMATDSSNDMVLQPDNNIVVVGGGCTTADCSAGTDTFVTRFTSNGNTDTTFGNGGAAVNDFSTGNDSANSVVIEPKDNKILAGGNQSGQFTLHRFNINGTLDSTFGTNGTFTTTVGQGGTISDIALQVDNKLIVTGSISNGSYNDWGLARYTGLVGPVALWFSEGNGNKISRITTSGVFNEFVVPTANSTPVGITLGPDGNNWFTEGSGNKIGQVTPSGSFTEYTIPTVSSTPTGIASGSDGALWFTENTGNKIGRVTTSGSFTEYTVPTANSRSIGITSGPDGNNWFTEGLSNKIGRITTSGTFTEFIVPTVFSGPAGITAGPDGALWFTEGLANKIGRVTTSGTFTEFVVPTANSTPSVIAAGSDGALWFTENTGNKIGRVTTSGSFTEYTVPTTNSRSLGIVSGPDGALWFTENTGNKVGRLTTAGVFTEFVVPTANSAPAGITAGQ